MRIAVILVALWTVCCSVVWQVEAASDAFITPPYGPLRLVNQQPTQLLFLQSFPEEANVTPPGRVGCAPQCRVNQHAGPQGTGGHRRA